MCETRSARLVRYPATLAPTSGSVTVTAYCADNAHRASSGLNVECSSNGRWSGDTPVCDCDVGYNAVTDNNDATREICEGLCT